MKKPNTCQFQSPIHVSFDDSINFDRLMLARRWPDVRLTDVPQTWYISREP